MKKTVLVLLLLLPLAGCAHQQSGYAGGSGGYFAGDCLDSYGCGDDYYRQGYFYGYPNPPSSPERARVAKLERRASTRVVTRSSVSPAAGSRPAPARGSTSAAGARSSPAAVSRGGGRR